ncbi:transposase [Streptomyces lydicus]|uniref:transposase n=1 Tax=Streptomyces lydicus TaxID=47763 RepID=UPI0036FB1924
MWWTHSTTSAWATGESAQQRAHDHATGLPLAFVLTPGQAGDSPQFHTVLGKIRLPGPVGRPRTRPEAIAADRAYSSQGQPGLLTPAPHHGGDPGEDRPAGEPEEEGSVGGRPVTYDKECYKQHNTVERCFQKIKAWHGLATRYDRAPDSYAAGLHLRRSGGGPVCGLRDVPQCRPQVGRSFERLLRRQGSRVSTGVTGETELFQHGC